MDFGPYPADTTRKLNVQNWTLHVNWTFKRRAERHLNVFMYNQFTPCICRMERKRWIVKQVIQTKILVPGILAYISFKSTWSFYIKKKYWKIIIPFLITFSRPGLYCESRYVFRKFLRSHIWGSASFKEKEISQTFLCKC